MARRCTHIREKGGFFGGVYIFLGVKADVQGGRKGDSGGDEHESEMECELLLLPSSSFLTPPSLFFTLELAFHLQQSRRIWRGEGASFDRVCSKSLALLLLLFPTLTLHFLLRRILLAFVVELPRTRGGFADRKRRQNTYPIHRLSSSHFCYLFEMFRKKIGDVAVHALFILAFSFQKILSRHGASPSFVLFHGWTDEEEEE